MHVRVCGVVVALTIGVHGLLLAWAAAWQSPTHNEVAHLPAGISHWQWGQFALYRVNPPLVRMIAALPVHLQGNAHTDWTNYDGSPLARSDFMVGRDFVAANDAGSFRHFILARWACIPFSLLGAYICFRWARDVFGQVSGLVALILWCVCPNILGHAGLITPDIGATALGVTAGYCFWRWTAFPNRQRAFAAGILLGLALLTKFTWITLFVLWPTMWAASSLNAQSLAGRASKSVQVVQLAMILAIGIYVLNLGYAFDGTCRRLDSYLFQSMVLTGSAEPRFPGNRFVGSLLGPMMVPFPAEFVQGIDAQKADFEGDRISYLRGRFTSHGWWYYYLYALAVKVPIGSLLLAVLACGLALVRRYRACWRNELHIAVPGIVVLALVSAEMNYNAHLRYILPAFPFAFISISRVGRAVQFKNKVVASAAGVAMLWSLLSAFLVYPHSLSYFNEVAGGPANGHAHLVDSNIDWGQDLFYLKNWVEKHPEARPLYFAYYGSFEPRSAGIEYQSPPVRGDGLGRSDNHARYGPSPGWHAVSVSLLRGLPSLMPDGQGQWRSIGQGELCYYLKFRPVAMAGYSIYIYHISHDDAVRVRRELGLLPLKD